MQLNTATKHVIWMLTSRYNSPENPSAGLDLPSKDSTLFAVGGCSCTAASQRGRGLA